MAKIIDITDKLNFEQAPKIVIKGEEIEINNKAVDILKITPVLQKENIGIAEINQLYETLFSSESRKKVEALNLDLNDFNMVIMQAAQLITGSSDEGEAQTHTMT